MLRKQIIRNKKMFLPQVRNIFDSQTQILLPKHMLSCLATMEAFCPWTKSPRKHEKEQIMSVWQSFQFSQPFRRDLQILVSISPSRFNMQSKCQACVVVHRRPDHVHRSKVWVVACTFEGLIHAQMNPWAQKAIDFRRCLVIQKDSNATSTFSIL